MVDEPRPMRLRSPPLRRDAEGAKSAQLTLRIAAAIKERLQQLAFERDRSVAYVVEEMLREGLDRLDAERVKKPKR